VPATSPPDVLERHTSGNVELFASGNVWTTVLAEYLPAGSHVLTVCGDA
jgi:hypothetical protein